MLGPGEPLDYDNVESEVSGSENDEITTESQGLSSSVESCDRVVNRLEKVKTEPEVKKIKPTTHASISKLIDSGSCYQMEEYFNQYPQEDLVLLLVEKGAKYDLMEAIIKRNSTNVMKYFQRRLSPQAVVGQKLLAFLTKGKHYIDFAENNDKMRSLKTLRLLFSDTPPDSDVAKPKSKITNKNFKHIKPTTHGGSITKLVASGGFPIIESYFDQFTPEQILWLLEQMRDKYDLMQAVINRNVNCLVEYFYNRLSTLDPENVSLQAFLAKGQAYIDFAIENDKPRVLAPLRKIFKIPNLEKSEAVSQKPMSRSKKRKLSPSPEPSLLDAPNGLFFSSAAVSSSASSSSSSSSSMSNISLLSSSAASSHSLPPLDFAGLEEAPLLPLVPMSPVASSSANINLLTDEDLEMFDEQHGILGSKLLC